MCATDKSKLPPGPKAKFPLGNLFSFRKDCLGFLKSIADEYGDIVHFKIGPIRVVLLNHPDYIKEVLSTQNRNFKKGRPLEMAKELLGDGLLTSEGEFHRKHSRIIQPAFHRNMLDSYAPVISGCAEKLMKDWADGMEVDIKKEMRYMSIAIAGEALFGADTAGEAAELDKALETATSLFGRIPLPFSEWLLKLPLPENKRFYKAKKRLDSTIHRMIEERRRLNADSGDLISLLLRAQRDLGKDAFSDQEIRDEAITLFLTAFDTTSVALTWTWYLLSLNPEAEAALHEELDRVLKGRLPNAEDVAELKYTRMVFGESLRMYPPSYLIPRQAIEAFAIGDYTIPAGTIILLSPYLMHHDPRFHEDPEKFNPRAWDRDVASQRSKYEYFPFSRGPRSCIGEPFAWLQGVLAIATIARFWKLELESDHPVELETVINLRPKKGIKMILKKRK
ncbi:cytochrome P450 [Flavihumibacter stibioxidans]|uniref:Cytochrome P450 n=1 Tax=Flavihumibacter stibioxidans TaxID=1834163 RepID=A0ABR7MAH2_9BACT|nr:cytochrome P450 [Flavihumibacter stibioxidans]MBC6492035.1 cytochrome P450 [Flavihumibacter stibioxidans]